MRNLADALLRRQPPPLWVTSKPGEFWPDVFVASKLPLRPFLQSAIYHAFGLVVLYGLTTAYLDRYPPVRRVLEEHSILYYDVSEYLPAVDSGSKPAREEQKGEPVKAPQPIVSLPKAPDNSTQTIIDPTTIKITSEQARLPNLVIWTPEPVPVPEAALQREGGLTLPAELAVVAPPPTVQRDLSKLKRPAMPEAAVIGPPPSVDAARLAVGGLNIGESEVMLAEPKLPVAAQRSLPGELVEGSGEVVPPPPSTAGAGSGANAMGQLIALGIHPVDPTGPIQVPGGNRRGIFAAGPEGKEGGAGTPDIHGGGSAEGGGGRGTGSAGAGRGGDGGSPLQEAGISIGGTKTTGPVAVVAGSRPGLAAGPFRPEESRGPRGTTTVPRLLSPEEVARRAVPRVLRTGDDQAVPGTVEDEVFGEKKFYSMMLNMPNLTSAAGSWVIRFAELEEDNKPGELVAPVAVTKVDPAYPPELNRLHIEGIVTLYAVIGKDGAVRDARVLRGVDERLDENARAALLRWHFLPATKNGASVDLEAVVLIPFQARPVPY